MSIERCKNCEVIIIQQSNGSWEHRISRGSGTENACNNPEIGMGLHELILEYWRAPQLYAVWAHLPGTIQYSRNCILNALQFQATIHWNSCGNSCNAHCTNAAKRQADGYMEQCKNGRHDLHPTDDQDVHMLAFEIHNKRLADGIHEIPGRPGVMTCTYVVGTGSSEACDCYNRGYTHWILQKQQILEHRIMANTPIDPDDRHYEPRFE